MKWALVGFYFLAVFHIHFRGKVRLPFGRQLFDHSSFMAPINIFMHLFSRVPSTPYIPVRDFPELAPLQANWQIIRAEAENMLAMKKIKAAEQNDDADQLPDYDIENVADQIDEKGYAITSVQH